MNVESTESIVEEKRDPGEEFKAYLSSQQGDWYVIYSYSGYEKSVKTNIEQRIQTFNREDEIFEVEVPMEEVVEIKNTQRKLVKRVRIPGYVLVRMVLTDESWNVVRHTPGVTGFVGNAHNPTPLTLDEVYSMLAPSFLKAAAAAEEAEEGSVKAAAVKAAMSVGFEIGESVIVKDGPFETLPATVSEIKPELQQLVVMVTVFERETPVTLGVDQVIKV